MTRSRHRRQAHAVITDRTLRANILRRSNLAAVQLGHAQKVKGRAKSGYYQAAVMYLASVVEALLHVVLQHAQKKGKAFPDAVVHSNYTQLPKHFFGRDVFVCRRTSKPLQIVKNTDMKDTISCCKDMKIISSILAQQCDRVRVLRNRIHLMGRERGELRFTKQHIDLIGSVIDSLLHVLDT